MIYVVTPSGELLIFHTAKWLTRSNGESSHSLLEAKEGKWVADVPANCVVSFERPQYTLASEPGCLADIKRALRNFDARTGQWRHT